MCDVFACYDPSGSIQDDLATQAILNALSRRGPDGSGFVHEPGCSLGHTRLAIVDSKHGGQPMRHSPSGLVISYNGEIYNAGELRRMLGARGQIFSTRSDTEVVLAAFAEFGLDSISMLDGMFAFVVWDPRARRLHAVRDRMGEKPLFHTQTPDGRRWFASDIKALRVAEIELSYDNQALGHFLEWKFVPPDRSAYAQVEVVPAAHVLTFGPESLRAHRFWDLPRSGDSRCSPDSAIEELDSLMAGAVSDRLISDQPVGLFLSGGVDSALIGSYCNEGNGEKRKAFTLAYAGERDESVLANAAAASLGLAGATVQLEAPDICALEELCAYMDQPHADSANLAQALVSCTASAELGVVLSGDGADELFWGYPWYSAQDPLAFRQQRMTIFSSEQRKLLLPGVKGYEYSPEPTDNDLDAVNRIDLCYYLGGQLLPKADALGMMHGLEVRAPFLDRKVIQFARSLPASLKQGKFGKPLLRELMHRRCPELRISDVKQGFGAPLETWFSQVEFNRYVRERIGHGARIRALLDPKRLDREIDEAFSNLDRPACYRLWTLLCLELWLAGHSE